MITPEAVYTYETWYDGEEIERDVVRDDTENEIVSVTKV